MLPVCPYIASCGHAADETKYFTVKITQTSSKSSKNIIKRDLTLENEMQAALYTPPTVHCPIQYEADDVTEVLGVQRATRGTAHVTADGHGDLAHFWVAVVTTKENTPNASRTCNNRSKVINLYPLVNNSTPRNTNY